jgi:type IV secretory pathway TrbD component
MADFDDKAPPAGEDIHLPGPSILPLLVAIAVTCSIIGLTLSIWFSIFGVALFIIPVGLGVRDVRRDVDDLPEEHHSH